MNYTTKAIYHQGTFVPETARDLPEGAEFELIVQGPLVEPPMVTDPEERAQILKQVAAQMRENPFPAAAPRYTRDELHERR
ncbi:MAG: hypothetical protein ACLQLG_04225 [Thermoguttaceae bacterium]